MQLEYETRYIETDSGRMRLLILRPQEMTDRLPGVLWIHGGGYYEGMPDMLRFSRIKDAVRHFGAVAVSPGYRLSGTAPYPAALEDCYAALLWMRDNADSLGIDPGRLIVGGESAGGGLTAALCMLAHDRGEVDIFYQFPLYPMLDCFDTDSSRDNHSLGWNTKRNHEGWRKYLGPLWGSADIPAYASPSRRVDYSGLPPCYTFVGSGEPFYCETLRYVEELNKAGVPAKADVYDADVHAFDLLLPLSKNARAAREAFLENYRQAVGADKEYE